MRNIKWHKKHRGLLDNKNRNQKKGKHERVLNTASFFWLGDFTAPLSHRQGRNQYFSTGTGQYSASVPSYRSVQLVRTDALEGKYGERQYRSVR